MTIWNFVRGLRKRYDVSEIYYAYKDLLELRFLFDNNVIYLAYSGETIRESTFKDMLRRVEDDLNFSEGESDVLSNF